MMLLVQEPSRRPLRPRYFCWVICMGGWSIFDLLGFWKFKRLTFMFYILCCVYQQRFNSAPSSHYDHWILMLIAGTQYPLMQQCVVGTIMTETLLQK